MQFEPEPHVSFQRALESNLPIRYQNKISRQMDRMERTCVDPEIIDKLVKMHCKYREAEHGDHFIGMLRSDNPEGLKNWRSDVQAEIDQIQYQKSLSVSQSANSKSNGAILVSLASVVLTYLIAKGCV